MVRHLARTLAVAVVIACGCFGRGASGIGAQTAPPDAFSRTRAAVEALRLRTGAPGVAVVVTAGERVVLTEGFGVASVETAAPMTPELVTHVGSVTKSLTAALVLMLEAEGRLRLHAPISAAVRGLVPAVGRLSLHELLSQTAGLRDAPGADGSHDEAALLAAARALRAADVVLPRGTVFSYSNPGYALAGLAAQEAAGVPYAELLHRRVLAPLGMSASTMRPLEALTRPFVAGHEGGRGVPVRVVRPVDDDAALRPAGYLFASTRDLGRWAMALANDGRLDGVQAIPAPVVRAMRTPRAAIPSMRRGLHYGYGLMLDRADGRPGVWHAGTNRGHAALVRVVPDARVGVVVTCNLDGVRLDEVAEAALADALALPGAAAGPDARAVTPAARQWAPVDAATLRRLAGRYENRLAVTLRLRDDTLRLEGLGPERALRAVGRTPDGRVWLVSAGPAGDDTVVVTPPRRDAPGYASVYLWALPRRGAAAHAVTRAR